jgi:hypothetical protein
MLDHDASGTVDRDARSTVLVPEVKFERRNLVQRAAFIAVLGTSRPLRSCLVWRIQ